MHHEQLTSLIAALLKEEKPQINIQEVYQQLTELLLRSTAMVYHLAGNELLTLFDKND